MLKPLLKAIVGLIIILLCFSGAATLALIFGYFIYDRLIGRSLPAA